MSHRQKPHPFSGCDAHVDHTREGARGRPEAKDDDDEHDKPDAGDAQGAKPNTGDEPAAPNESKPETGEPPPADAPKADDEDDKAKGLDAAEAAKGFVEAFKQYIRGV